MNRAYSVFEIKSANDETRTLEGVATTPNPDRMGDVIVTEGIEFKLPLPLLYQHDAKTPLGTVTRAKVTKEGISVTAQVAPAGLDVDIDKAWTKIKAGLVRGFSIGFRTIEESFDKAMGGFRILKSEWIELSAVTIPANAEATITSVKAFDVLEPAALGIRGSIVDKWKQALQPAGVSANLKAKSMTLTEQITGFENKRASLDARQTELMDGAAASQRSLDATESEEYDGLETQLKDVDAHITRLRAREKSIAARAVPVTKVEEPLEVRAAAASRAPSHVITVKKLDPPGIGMARVCLAIAHGRQNWENPVDIAKRRWPDNPEVALTVKTVIEAADTTTSGWASQLVPSAVLMADEFRGIYRPSTIIGRLPVRRVPFNIAVPIETASGTAQWVGEGAPKPVTKLTLTSVSLLWAKAAAIVGITEELVRVSTPAAEMVVRDSMVATLVRFFDSYFVGANAEVANLAPAGILNSISGTPITPTGTTAAAFRTDFANLLDNFTANNIPLSGIVILMSASQAVNLSLAVTDLGVALFPTITQEGGTILGFPVIVSEAVGTKIIAINAPDILLAEDPGVRVAVSNEATVEMSDAPLVGDQSPTTGAVLKSAFQNNLIFIRFEQFITWKKARSTAVEYITGNAYKP